MNLSTFVTEVTTRYKSEKLPQPRSVSLDSQQDLFLMADSDRIEQVLTNLLINAAKYAPGTPVLITVRRENDEALIIIKDQGPGIARDKQHLIFERFERNTSKNEVSGLGLGLYISKQIIEAHHGKISLASEVGGGAEFKIHLPLNY